MIERRIRWMVIKDVYRGQPGPIFYALGAPGDGGAVRSPKCTYV